MVTKPSENWLILPPTTGRPTTAAGLVLYYHGAGETVAHVVINTLSDASIVAIRAAGYMVASNTAHGDNCGNVASLADYTELYRYCADTWKINRVMHIGQSMGSLPALNMVASKVIPTKGYLGIYPVCSLQYFYDSTYSSGAFPAMIRAAYGIAGDGSDYVSKTAGYDPLLRNADSFNGIRMRFYASANDTVVGKTENSDAMNTLLTGHVIETEVVVCTGTHGDPSHFQPADYVSFLNRCI
jgi:hypothetical protein